MEKNISVKELIKQLEDDKAFIQSATDYLMVRTGQYLKHGTACDSSVHDSKRRMVYIEKAEKIFINNHKREIIDLAVELINEDLKND